ncbi:phage repressor antirepressor Ant [Paramuricea clavata]|uniref:Phage repressor antirepressor Ant n=1 Tax=Paramuricea clavata TaxID=317549 RepID=A0A6S7JXX2_PARCT|nr:phage repressor antirepressor Ant [Paramuricea clavata]
MEKLFRNQKLNVSVRIIESGEEVLFYAKDVAESLGYSNTKKAIQVNVWKKNKVTLRELKGGTLKGPTFNYQPNCVFLREQGLYQLIFKSRLPIAEAFQDWVVTDVLPSIRKTGSYNLPDRRSLRYNQIILINETDLHYAVVSYIRDNYPEAVILPGLGEYQDTVSKRCDAWKKGYKGGQPDLIIENPMGKYKGFAIEFKSPKGTGVISENQDIWFRKLRGIGYMTMVSDDLVKTCIRINEYFSLKKTVRKVVVKNIVSDINTYRPRFDSGVAIALVSLVLAYKSHQKETREQEPKHVTETVEITRKADASKLDSLE